MPVYRLTIEYDGTNWHGWQSQPDGKTIQDTLESAITTVLRSPARITGSGRTDAGVHAHGQVAHLQTIEAVDGQKILNSINGILPRSIVVLQMELVHDSFHARYDAMCRSYSYHICTVPSALLRKYRWFVRPDPDVVKMNLAARGLLGSHDFSSFCKTTSATKNRVCTVRRARWYPDSTSGTWVFRIDADRYLHGMVRAIVGTLIDVGHARRDAASIESTLEAKDRRRAGHAAPACGLFLEHVAY